MWHDGSRRDRARRGRRAQCLASRREKAAAFPAQLAAAMEQAVKDTTGRLTTDAQARETLMQKEAEGEQKVLNSRIESLQQAVQEQQQIAKLSTQIEKPYGQVQEIAVKAIEGSAGAKNARPAQPAPTEAPRTTAKADD